MLLQTVLSRAALLQLAAVAGLAAVPPGGSPPAHATATTPLLARLPPSPRIVAVGDIHGDAQALIDVLSLAGLYSEAEGRWTGGDATFVQIGDVLDRGDDERRVLDLLRELKPQAAAAGGRVVTLLGNHEVLNVLGIMSFVSPRSNGFGDDRAAAFRPGGPLASELASWPVACVIGETAFCHAGLSLAEASRVDATNRAAAEWLREGHRGTLPPTQLMPTPNGKSPLWWRGYSDPAYEEPPPETCEELCSALEVIGAKRLVVGHTPQRRINCGCAGAVWRVDLGLSRAMGGGVPEVQKREKATPPIRPICHTPFPPYISEYINSGARD